MGSKWDIQDRITSNCKLLVRALRHRNYRLFFTGQTISMIGTWMQDIAINWLIYQLTGSALMLGTVNFCSKMPGFMLGPLAGLLVDRFSRHKIIIFTQIMSMLQALVMAVLVLSNRIEVWHVMALGTMLGCIQAFDMPARHAFIVDLVDDREDMNNAIALNSIIINVARLIGPSIAGILIAIVGEGICFLLNAGSFVAVIAALLAMRIRTKHIESASRSMCRELCEGFTYAYQFLPIRYLFFLLWVISFLGMPYIVFMPIFADQVLGGGSYILGFLFSATGLGAICGASFLAARSYVAGLENIIPVAAGLFGLALTIFSQNTSIWLALGIMFFAGIGMIMHSIATNTLLQTVVDDDKRGRIMSMYSMAFQGLTPLGSLLAGFLAERIGAPATECIFGSICLLGAIAFYNCLPKMKAHMNAIYN
ncbi:MFS transporter [Sporomusa sp.]|jgi:MFS family permease|uniref:MFS transporter n=1 Tax=Sporomusa sp. TaxID=2078658 RepID=UPI002D0FBBB4|nr:MFS transporter [Sporomusa sp.]MDF2873894.1 entS [Sporomusa sp.]HWR08594.1 MFS transporter [Sporomusa sp.]